MPEYKTTQGSGYVTGLNINWLNSKIKNRLRKNLAKNLYPVGYHFPVSRIVFNGLFGIQSPYRADYKQSDFDWTSESDQSRDRYALLSKYLGENSGVSFDEIYKQSEYSPSTSSQQNVKYYTINDSNILSRIKRLGGQAMNYTIGKGRDDKGEYYSFYDLWDINPWQDSGKSDITHGIGTPIELYDRVYNTPENKEAYEFLQNEYVNRKNAGNITNNGNTYTNTKVRATTPMKSGGKLNYTKYFK